jgi:hypothetical protein
MRLKNGLRKKTIKAIKTILLIMNDKEKIKEVLGILEIKIKDYEDEHKEFFDSMQYAEASRFKHMKELLEEIKKTLS